MPIDSRIPLGVTGPDPNGFVNALAAGMKLSSDERTLDLAERKTELANQLAVAKEKRQADASAVTTDKTKVETVIKRLELGAHLLGGAKDQASYDVATADATTAGLDTSHWPKKFFPDWVGQTRQRALSMKDQADLQLRQDSQDETKRYHNETLLGQEEGRQETARYHGVQDANSDASRAETNRHNVVQESKSGKNGLSITGYDAQGRPLIQVGGASPFGKTAVTKLEETQIQGIEGLARLDEIRRVAKPELLTYGNKLKDWGLDLKSKAGFDLSPEDQKFRGDYTAMRQTTMVNLNKTIKDQTGATITENEVPRIMATVPTMDDAPDQFPTKLNGADRLLRNGVIRAQIAREQGMDPLQSGIDLGDTKTLMDKREAQLRRHYGARAPGMDPAQVDAAIEKQIRQEFGY